MKKNIKYILIIIFLLTLSACQSVEVIPISQNQEKISSIQDYILRKSIFDLNISSYQKIPLTDLFGESYENIDLLRNEIPYLNSNLSLMEKQIKQAYKKSIIEVQKILIDYSEKVEYPLLYPDVENNYKIVDKSYSILFEQLGDELNLEIDYILEKNLNKTSTLYTTIANDYNIYCIGLEYLGRPTLPTIPTYIKPRLKTLFIKKLMTDLNQNEETSVLLNTEIDPTNIYITRE